MDGKLGTLEKDRIANFLITSDNIFSEGVKIHENWVKGKKYIIKDRNVLDIAGSYSLTIDGKKYNLTVTGTNGKYKGSIKQDTAKIKAIVAMEDQLISISFAANDKKYDGLVSLSGKVNYKSGIWDGRGQTPDGKWVKWGAIKQRDKGEKKPQENRKVTQKDTLVGNVWYPNMAYGFDSIPNATTILFTNATVWTNDTVGILQNASVLLEDGKIAAVGKDITAPEGAAIIDAKGKHLTPGIIDEHSHIAISRGVNECTQAVTAEVSIADVVNSDDINIYRQLSGGVTASQLLHGSCNPVGGQSALIKLRWGHRRKK